MDAASLASSQSTATLKLGDAPPAASQPFPQLRNNADADADTDPDADADARASAGGGGSGAGSGGGSGTAKATMHRIERGRDDNDDDEDPAVAKPFLRMASPDHGPAARLSADASSLDDEEEEGEEDEGRGRGRAAQTATAAAATAGGGGGGRHGRKQDRRRSAAAHHHERMGHKMHKFTLYETAMRYFIVGEDVTGRRFRVLKIDRTTTDDGKLSITDDKIVYTQQQMVELLDTIDNGNRATGGIKLRCTTWGLLGFIRFTGPYYIVLITKKATVAVIGGHIVYQITDTDLIPLTPGRVPGLGGGGGGGGGGGSEEAGSGDGSAGGNGEGNGGSTQHPHPHPHHHHHHHAHHHQASAADEARFLAILKHINLTQSFYFSYSYDITNTLQHNISKEREALAQGRRWPCDEQLNTMFVWNSYLLQPAHEALAPASSPFDWCRPITHGYIDQASISVYGRTAYVAIIARRSRHFAGARFLKRGANDLGYVANDVETEQIVSEASTTSFHSPGPRLFANPQYTAYVQHRGSIPLYWTQENAGVTPKPPIELNLVDPFYSVAALHFDDLFARYGAPIYVLNLVKARETTPRESKLLDEFTRALRYLNQFLPPGTIIHHPWDMSRASKSPDVNVIRVLEGIAETVVATTGFFRNGEGTGGGDGDDDAGENEDEVDGIPPPTPTARVQNGVARTNCIDCLDRTNAAQFVIGKCALGHQLHALGLLDTPRVEWETDAVNLFTHMYHDHGDTIAVQYGGSQLVNTMETYRKINQWTSHSRDMLESFKRYYNNSFLDGQRQEAYNLFLGNYVYVPGQPLLWDLPTDYYLHHADPRRRPADDDDDDDRRRRRRRHDYIHWYTPEHLRRRTLPPLPPPLPVLAAPAPAAVKQRHADPHTRRVVAAGKPLAYFDEYWLEFYRPYFLSSFAKMFTYRIKSTMKYIPIRSTRDGQYDLSPFKVRSDAGTGGGSGGGGDTDSVASSSRAAATAAGRRRGHKKEVSFAVHHDDADAASVQSGSSAAGGGGSSGGLRSWLHPGAGGGSSGSPRSRAGSETSVAASSRQQRDRADQGAPAHGGYQGMVRDSGGDAPNGGGGGGGGGGVTTAAAMAMATTATDPTTVTSSAAHSSGRRAGGSDGAQDASSRAGGRYVYDGAVAGSNSRDLMAGGRPGAAAASRLTLDTTTAAAAPERSAMAAAGRGSAGAGSGAGSGAEPGAGTKPSALEKSRRAQDAFARMVEGSLDPAVRETEDYERYIRHPQHLQLVVSEAEPEQTLGISAASSAEYQEYVRGAWKTDGLGLVVPGDAAAATAGAAGGDDERAMYAALLQVPADPLTVTEGDAQKKRYKAYRKWLRGKSLFKQQPVE